MIALSYSLSWPLHWGLLIYNTEILSRIRGTRVVDYYHGSKNDRTLGHSSTCLVSHNATVWVSDVLLGMALRQYMKTCCSYLSHERYY